MSHRASPGADGVELASKVHRLAPVLSFEPLFLPSLGTGDPGGVLKSGVLGILEELLEQSEAGLDLILPIDPDAPAARLRAGLGIDILADEMVHQPPCHRLVREGSDLTHLGSPNLNLDAVPGSGARHSEIVTNFHPGGTGLPDDQRFRYK